MAQAAGEDPSLVWRQVGARSLVLGATTSHVEGMDPDEGRALLDELLAWSTTPIASTGTNGRSATWSSGTNRGVLHRALPYDAASARDMHRTTISGEEPIQ